MDASILVGFPRTCQGPPQPAADTSTDQHNPITAATVENTLPAPFLAWKAGDGETHPLRRFQLISHQLMEQTRFALVEAFGVERFFEVEEFVIEVVAEFVEEGP